MSTVMEHDESVTERQKQQQEYNQAVILGFAGTFEEYLEYRDYT